MSRNWRSGILYSHWERKLTVVCLKLFVALGLDCSTTRTSLSGIASKDLDPTAESHCLSLNALFFDSYANTGSHSDSNNHRSPKSHFRRHNDCTQQRLGVHPRWKTLILGSPAIIILGTGLLRAFSFNALGYCALGSATATAAAESRGFGYGSD